MKFEQTVFVIAIIWYTITAWFSSGYIHLDEQYQIIEFAGYINGWNNANELAWEFSSQIRSSIQPFLCASFFKFCEWINVTNPFHQAFVLRLITALFSVLSIRFFINSFRNIVTHKFWRIFVILSYFIWFLPYINVRFSSETWSELFLLLAIGIHIRNAKKAINYWYFGVSLGFAFIFRFQAGIAIATIGCWVVFKERISPKLIGMTSLGFGLVFILGIVLEYFFYGNWTFTSWNYLRVNLIEGVASSFGVSPFYYYIQEIYKRAFTPFGIIVLATTIYAIIKKRNQLVTWVVLVFIIVHSMIGHKEVRFIFPIINLLPVFVIWFLEGMDSLNPRMIKSKIFKIGVLFLIGINAIGLVISSTTPPSSGRIETAKQISDLNI